jgi:branched-chain amino acid transport system substrate-binding protein
LRRLGLLCAGLVLAGTACGGQAGARLNQASLQPIVKIALVDTFSGPAAASGQVVANSLQVQVDDLNARGGLLGSRVEIVTADGEQDPGKTSELARQQLSDLGVQLLVGPSSTALFQSVMPLVNRAGVPNCVTNVADDALQNASLTFRADARDRERIAALLDYLRRARPDVKKVALIDDGDQTGQSYDRQLGTQAGRAGLAYGGRTAVGDTDADYRPAVQQALAQGVQAVVLAGQPAAMGRVAQAITQEGGGKVLVAGSAGLDTYDFAAAAGDAAPNVVFAGPNQDYLSNVRDTQWPAGYRAFVKTVTREFGYALNGAEMRGLAAPADCVLQWSRAVARAGTFRAAEVTRAWESLDVPAADSAQGVHEQPTPSDHTGIAAADVFVYSWVKSGGGFRLKRLAGPNGS